MFNIFKINKVLKQAKIYVDEVNKINDELSKMCDEQLDIIDKLNKDNARLRQLSERLQNKIN